ncbi:MAG: ABC transporter ATP-binding protein, partial [Selenomonadales bacterium]|nr:ABC transporter ATP-binding protein [Selenomonadales bacterium]
EVLLLVGENGAGKTTLTKLMSRLYDPDAGEITWGGTNLKGVDIKELRERIAVVVQDYARFPVTARDNIGFGDLAKLHDDSTLLLAAQEVGLDIAELPLGLDTPLSKMLEQGTDLSVGQWQKVAIARALLRQTKAELVLLDEPTAAIDPQSEHKILEILREFVGGKMAIVVSHRLSLARVAHRIAVLSGGRIVEQGTHAELMALGGRYCDMFTRQASSYI